MSVVLETTLGDVTIDLFLKERPRACLNFLKLCKIKYYNYNLFHTVNRGFIAQTGDPTGLRKGGESIFGVLGGPLKRYFEAETQPRIKHTAAGLVSFVGVEENMIGSQFFVTLASDLTYLDGHHCVFGEVVEGLDIIELLNEAICDNDNRPYQDIRITHTVVLDDPYPDPKGLHVPDRSPSPSAERLQGGRIAPDEEIDESVGKDLNEIEEMKAEREAKARATILEMVGDIPDADMAPPENVLFVCKLNPVTTDDDLEIIFSRFGKIKCCEVIRDRKTNDSLQYAFIEFTEPKSCEDAYFKMDNVLIDDRRIHVDFSQSVAKIKWHGKGRGVTHYDSRGYKTDDVKNNLGKGNYKSTERNSKEDRNTRNRDKESEKRDTYSSNRNRDRKSPYNPRNRSSPPNRAEKYREGSKGSNKGRSYYNEKSTNNFHSDSRKRHRENSPNSSRNAYSDNRRRNDDRGDRKSNRDSSQKTPIEVSREYIEKYINKPENYSLDYEEKIKPREKSTDRSSRKYDKTDKESLARRRDNKSEDGDYRSRRVKQRKRKYGSSDESSEDESDRHKKRREKKCKSAKNRSRSSSSSSSDERRRKRKVKGKKKRSGSSDT